MHLGNISPNARSKRLRTENLVQTEKKENKADDDASNAPRVVKIIGNWGRRKKRYQKIDYEGAFQCKICEKFFSTNYITSALFSFFSVCTRFSVFNLLDLAFGDCFC
jgi:hypothetical protein